MDSTTLWGEIISGTVSGVVSGVLLAATLFLLNWGRNRRLESKLRAGFSRCGISLGDDIFGLVIENRLPIEVRIRAVVLVGRQGNWLPHLKYIRPVEQATLLNALGHDRTPQRIVAGAHFATQPDPGTAVSLTGFAGGLWGLSYEVLREWPWEINGGWMIIEYPTIFGGSAFLRVHLNSSTVRLVQENVARVRGLQP